MTKPRILIFCDYYLPGVKAGGPIRSIANLIEALSNDFDFSVVTRDRDWGDEKRYPNLPNTWPVNLGGAKIYYLSPDQLTFKVIKKIIKTTNPKVVYLNSFFSCHFSIKLILAHFAGIMKNIGFILAPKGELSSGPLSLKRFKKSLYLFFAKFLKLYKHVRFHASTSEELADIQTIFPKASVGVAMDLTIVKLSFLNAKLNKISSRITRLVFISRISAKKNLLFALEQLRHIEGEVVFDIYGPIEDQVYWHRCQALINQLPDNIRVTHQGLLNHDKVGETFAQYDAFVLPTLGENYGHVIVEALAAACPVMLADTTPWLDLTEKQAGWVLPLNKPEDWQKTLQALVCMDEVEHAKLRQGALDYARAVLDDAETIEANKKLFETGFPPSRE